jgi:[protein-PII] uridylyltransferase
MPERYFLSTPEEEIPFHFRLMETFSGQTFVSAVRHFRESDYSEWVVCARDRPGLFALITGVVAASGLDILSARINTRKDGEPGKWERIRLTLKRVVEGEIDVTRLAAESGRPLILKRQAPKVPTFIQIDNAASDDFTILEVYTQDRIGVLFTITYALHQLRISIHLAKISTNVDQVADVFYVNDETGAKIENKKRLEMIRQTLYRTLVPENERVAQSAH